MTVKLFKLCELKKTMKCLRRLPKDQAPDGASFWSACHAQGLGEHHSVHITLGTTHRLDRTDLITVRRCQQLSEQQ